MFNCFKKFKILIEKKVVILNIHLKWIEDEFCYNDFYKDYGIKRVLTVPKSPQHNKMTW
jgi:hypothetical protein